MTSNPKSENEPTHLDLFSGIGGFALAAQWAGFRTIGFCEIDKYCQRVLAKNFLADADQWRREERVQSNDHTEQSGLEASPWNDANGCYSDIRQLEGREFAGVDLITGGFPCQPFSFAGKRRGAADDRALWPEMLRVIAEARPAWVLGENVAGIIGMELDAVLSDLEAIGYACRPFVIPACGVDARHRRNRVWIVGHAEGRESGTGLCETGSEQNGDLVANAGGDVPDADEQGLQGQWRLRERSRQWTSGSSSPTEYCIWLPEPELGRVAHGVPARVDRLRGLGNAIVPQVAFEILKAIRAQMILQETS